MRALKQKLARLVLPLAMRRIEARYRRPLLKLAEDPETAQRQLLSSILRANQQTDFGRRHGFAAIADWQAFRDAVPVQSYEDLRQAIERQARDGRPLLTEAQPLCYARTSGTTGQPKDIPVTACIIRQNSEAQQLSALTLYRRTRFFEGEVLAFTGAAVEGRKGCGIAFGSATGQAQASLSSLVKALFVLPDAASAIEDYEQKYYLAALLGLASSKLTGLAAANPSTFLKLVETVQQLRHRLLADLSCRNSALLDQLQPRLASEVRRRLKRSRPLPTRLRDLLAGDRPLSLNALWPDLGALYTWTGGSCAVALEALRPQLPADCQIVDIGYRASEVIATVNLDGPGQGCLPTLNHTVFEFVERAAWEDGRPDFRTLAELEEGAAYYVFVTTAAGLYRYDMNDLVRVTGWIGRTPTLAFLRKGRGVTSITGEKLAEEDVIAAVTAWLTAKGRHAPFFVALADPRSRGYRLLIELEGRVADRDAAAIDAALRARNLEYDAKRASGRLKPLQLVPLIRGAGEACKRQALARAQREAQYKPVCLAEAGDWSFDLSAFQLPEGAQ
ncbi:MAG: GH3 auxin-responsive promoter family protein [Kiloniellales bacterium]